MQVSTAVVYDPTGKHLIMVMIDMIPRFSLRVSTITEALQFIGAISRKLYLPTETSASMLTSVQQSFFLCEEILKMGLDPFTGNELLIERQQQLISSGSFSIAAIPIS